METTPDSSFTSNSMASEPKCCCGRGDCAFLKHNTAALQGLEKDVQTAAQLGQALLARHEAYIADAELERKRMKDSLTLLEKERQDLEEENTRAVEENRSLLSQLEDLNNELAESDAHVKSLTSTLQSSQQELHRLTVLSTRTTHIELQLMELEQERAQLQSQVYNSKEAEKIAIQKWHRSERMLADLHDQVEKIEKEAREERERHVEVVGRLERRRAVEKELESAAGRLKGAAAASSIGRGQSSNTVVSSFVKDILQDNANLQLGIVELRDMLANSNDEVQILREQLQHHRPAIPAERVIPAENLSSELGTGLDTPKNVSPEVHVHHHYHQQIQPIKSSEASSPRHGIRRVKKRRASAQLGQPMTPHRRHGSLTPTSSPSARPSAPPLDTAILSQTSASIPPAPSIADHQSHARRPTSDSTSRSAHGQRNSVALSLSTATSSVPNSPGSSHYIFDALGDTIDSSRPTTPGSTISSPHFGPLDYSHQRKISNTSFRSFTSPSIQSPSTSTMPLSLPAQQILEENLSERDIPESEFSTPYLPEPSLRRRSSMISISSIRGMDIHSSEHQSTLRSRPSQLTIRPSVPSTVLTPTTTITAAVVPKQSGTWDSTTYTKSILSGNEELVPTPVATGQTRSISGSALTAMKHASRKPSKIGLGGWIASKWGVSATSTSSPIPEPAQVAKPIEPTPSTSERPTEPEQSEPSASQPITISPTTATHPSAEADVVQQSSSERLSTTDSNSAKSPASPPSTTLAGLKWGGNALPMRGPGVNQLGAVPGWKKPAPLPQEVKLTQAVDLEALSASLRDQ